MFIIRSDLQTHFQLRIWYDIFDSLIMEIPFLKRKIKLEKKTCMIRKIVSLDFFSKEWFTWTDALPHELSINSFSFKFWFHNIFFINIYDLFEATKNRRLDFEMQIWFQIFAHVAKLLYTKTPTSYSLFTQSFSFQKPHFTPRGKKDSKTYFA